METHDESPGGAQSLLVLYADISGSTRLFEEHGDAKARDACAACIEVLTEVIEGHGGRVVKTIGDEVMAAFDDPSAGVRAGTDMQGAVRRASEERRFVTGELRIKVGLHYGHAIVEASDIAGEAPIVAQQAIKLAKADQVLTTSATLEAIPAMLRAGARFHDRVTSDATGAPIEVHELIWEISGLTQMADVALPSQRVTQTALELTYRGGTWRCDADNPEISIGRVDGNDLVVPTDLTSRHHAQIEYRRGRFYIADNSANGTLVLSHDGTPTPLRREDLALRGQGQICVGGNPESNPDGVIAFRCE